MRRKSPVTIQQWVDSLPIPVEKSGNADIADMNNKSSPGTSPKEQLESPRTRDLRGILSRDASFQSDDASSHCSSVESVLESRRPDPEAVLIGLGFGPSKSEEETSRIPKRFLQPSKVAGVNIERFLQEQRDREAATTYYWPHLQSTLNIGRDIKGIPSRDSSLGPPT